MIFFEHGESLTRACRKFGYPSRNTLRNRIIQEDRWSSKHKEHKKPTSLNETEKIEVTADLLSRYETVQNLAKKYNVSSVTLYNWYNELTGEHIDMKKRK